MLRTDLRPFLSSALVLGLPLRILPTALVRWMAQQIARSAMLASAKLGGRRAGSAMIVWRLADPIIPRRHALASPGHVGLHLVPDVGHLPQIEAPELRARPVRELIRAAA